MQAIVKTAREYGAVELKEIAKPEVTGTEVLIKIKASAICGSDLHAYEYPAGYEFMEIPVVLGHEYGGIVAAVGSEVSQFKIGDRVMGESNQFCSKCKNCHQGRTNICTNSKMTGLHVNGAMAEYIAVPEKIVHKIPDQVSFAEAALAQPCAVSFHAVFDRSQVRPGDSVVVYGPGIVGLMAAVGARLRGASTIFVVGTDADATVRLPLATTLGFIAINADQEEPAARINQITGSAQVDIGFECSGAASAVTGLLSLIRKGGSATLLGIYARNNEIFLTSLVRNEIQINTSYTCLWQNYEQALQLVASGQIDLKPLMTEYPFSAALQAFTDGLNKSVIKPVLILK